MKPVAVETKSAAEHFFFFEVYNQLDNHYAAYIC